MGSPCESVTVGLAFEREYATVIGDLTVYDKADFDAAFSRSGWTGTSAGEVIEIDAGNVDPLEGLDPIGRVANVAGSPAIGVDGASSVFCLRWDDDGSMACMTGGGEFGTNFAELIR